MSSTSSVLVGFSSGAIGGLITAWSAVWAPRRELRAQALTSLDELLGWLEDSHLSIEQMSTAHRKARTDLIVAGVPAVAAESFIAAAASYATWAHDHPRLVLGGELPELDDDQEVDLLVGQKILAAAHASEAAIRERLIHPIFGRWSTLVLRHQLWRYPLPPGTVPASTTSTSPRDAFKNLRSQHRNGFPSGGEAA